jgi:transposase
MINFKQITKQYNFIRFFIIFSFLFNISFVHASSYLSPEHFLKVSSGSGSKQQARFLFHDPGRRVRILEMAVTEKYVWWLEEFKNEKKKEKIRLMRQRHSAGDAEQVGEPGYWWHFLQDGSKLMIHRTNNLHDKILSKKTELLELSDTAAPRKMPTNTSWQILNNGYLYRVSNARVIERLAITGGRPEVIARHLKKPPGYKQNQAFNNQNVRVFVDDRKIYRLTEFQSKSDSKTKRKYQLDLINTATTKTTLINQLDGFPLSSHTITQHNGYLYFKSKKLPPGIKSEFFNLLFYFWRIPIDKKTKPEPVFGKSKGYSFMLKQNYAYVIAQIDNRPQLVQLKLANGTPNVIVDLKKVLGFKGLPDMYQPSNGFIYLVWKKKLWRFPCSECN